SSICFFFFSSRRRHTRFSRDWSSDVCSSDLAAAISGRQPLFTRDSSAQSLLKATFRAKALADFSDVCFAPGECLPARMYGVGAEDRKSVVGKECRSSSACER